MYRQPRLTLPPHAPPRRAIKDDVMCFSLRFAEEKVLGPVFISSSHHPWEEAKHGGGDGDGRARGDADG